MPLRAAPGEELGAAACAAGPRATRNRCYRHPLPALRGRLPARQRMNPHEPSQARPCHHREGLRASLSLIPLLLRGHTGGEDGGPG
jgi:hypothetical protein